MEASSAKKGKRQEGRNGGMRCSAFRKGEIRD